METTPTSIKKQDNCTASKIFEKARHLFNNVGVRNTTMDDLARELGISKKHYIKKLITKLT